ncbi:MAG: hypothetical protein ACREX4_20240, partial [Gammaproteobacteria bacterium]
MSSALSQWEIYRFELVFLNPEENRWQMFQEAVSQSGGSTASQPGTASQPNQGGGENDVGATYRKQAQELLTWVREAVTKEIHRSPHSKITARKTLDMVNINVTAMKEQLKRLCSDDFDKFIKRAITTTENTLESQGLSAGPFKDLFNAISDGTGRQYPLIPLKQTDALNLVSAMFVAREWDIFGRLSFPISQETKENPATVGTFAYSIVYPGEKNAENSTNAETALGYQVCLYLAGTRQLKATGQSYYRVCSDVNELEQSRYCFSGRLLDALHSGLAGKDVAELPKGRFHVRCFPLRICGYDHFLQIYLRPTNGVTGGLDRYVASDIPELFERNYVNGKPPKTYIVLKECLRELLVQMHIAVFQHHVAQELARYARALKFHEVDEIFCRHAPDLVRVEWVEITRSKKTKCFCYDRASNDPFEPKTWREWEDNQLSGTLRGEGNGSDHIASFVSWDKMKDPPTPTGRINAYVPWEDDFRGSLEPLFRGTGQQR